MASWKSKSSNPNKPLRWLLPLCLVPLLAVVGCDDDDGGTFWADDVTPPAIPAGVHTITGDGTVWVRWIPNREEDLAGYRIWWNSDLSENFEEIARISAFEDGVYLDFGTPTAADDILEYEDVVGIEFNGTYNSYAVSAFDEAGNESELSWEDAIDVPRPEGYDLVLFDRFVDPLSSGYDLSSLTEVSQDFALASTDFWFEIDGQGVKWFVVDPNFVRIQDYGYTGGAGFDGLDYAPADGYSKGGRAEALIGHAYALQISDDGQFDQDNHYAKIWVESFGPSNVRLWWGYQEVPGERELENESDGGVVVSVPLEEGSR